MVVENLSELLRFDFRPVILHPTILVAVDVEGGFGFGATFIWPACGSYNLGPEHDEKG